jgi:hypothetical protein
MDQHQELSVLIEELSAVWKRAQRARARYVKVQVLRLLARAWRAAPANKSGDSEAPMTSNVSLPTKELP